MSLRSYPGTYPLSYPTQLRVVTSQMPFPGHHIPESAVLAWL